MSFFKTLSCPLQRLPFSVQLAVTGCCFLLCCLIVVVGQSVLHSSSSAALFSLPVLLASWCFKRRGALLSVGSVLVFLAVFNTSVTGSLSWPRSTLWGLVFGGLGLLAEGVLISLLKDALDLSQQARTKAQQAEERQRRLQEMRTEFLLNVSHELRTPLTQLRGYLELLSMYRDQLDADTQVRCLQRALEGCDELHLLVDNVLDATHVSGGMRPPSCEVLQAAEVLQDVLTRVDPSTREAYTLKLECPESLTFWADAQYTRQILRNLLSNAFKYAPKQTAVVLSATLVEKDGAARVVCLRVKDEGAGIPLTEAPLLFEQFARLARDLSGPIPGTGLGLYISRQLVEAMGGRIWVESTGIPGEGSCFCFTLPHTSPQAQPNETGRS